ncbi:MAG: GAF and ANTAR domain-containing protein [Acidimicrobiales bacterium]
MHDDVSTDDVSAGELERNLVVVARALFAAGTVAGSLQRTVELAVATVEGCDAAGVFSLRDGVVVTAAATEPLVVELDELQFAHGQGPCLDAVAGGGTVYAAELAEDERWPRFGPAAAQVGIRSALAFRLSDRPASALNLYARRSAAFDATARAKGLIFATLAGLALDAAEERAGDEQRAANLHEALVTRELIGQAQGILIEREHITGDKAFDVLRRASQHLNVKVREIARTLVETGEAPVTGRTPGRSRSRALDDDRVGPPPPPPDAGQAGSG